VSEAELEKAVGIYATRLRDILPLKRIQGIMLQQKVGITEKRERETEIKETKV
jgi:hypothetical protein